MQTLNLQIPIYTASVYPSGVYSYFLVLKDEVQRTTRTDPKEKRRFAMGFCRVGSL